MRLKSLFKPVRSMTADEARAFMEEHREGSYILLDVRQEGEYTKARIPGAKLIPLPQLMDRHGELDLQKPVIVYWASGGRSRAAAQILSGKGFREVYNLKGGMKGWQGFKIAGPPEMGLERLRADEEPRDIIVFAYGMEEGLGGFYKEAAGKPGDSEVERLFLKLAGMEERHKNQLFLLYKNITGTDNERAAFEAAVVPGILEGGLTTEEFEKRFAGQEYSMDDVFSIAMMFEAQAMDLYMRYSERIEQAEAENLLHDLAQQEKAHLRALGELMDRKS